MVQLFIDRNIMISKCRQFKGMIKKKKKDKWVNHDPDVAKM